MAGSPVPQVATGKRAGEWIALRNKVTYLADTLANVREANESVSDAPESVRAELARLDAELEKWTQAL